ncbi:ABC transporter substrate-binding protein, partial [Frankia canadensis]|uniref:ABC transporter substrate-binding protein n=1 Tax=Frankia canadensis TaxID=1836972 RepID=UPI000C79D1FA
MNSQLSRRALLRNTGLLAAGGGAAALLAACGDDSSSASAAGGGAATDTVRLALDWTPNTNHTGFYVADKLGYLSENKIKLSIVPFSNAPADSLVAAGKADFSISFPTYMFANMAAGLPLVSVMSILQKDPLEIMVKADSDITRPKELDGKKAAGTGSPATSWEIRTAIQNDGGTGKFEEVTLNTDSYQAVYNGQVDFAAQFATWEGIQATLAGIRTRVFPFRDHGIPTNYSVVMAASTNYLSKNADLARRFVAAVVRGYEYAAKNPDESAQILADANPGAFTDPRLPKQSQEMLSKSYLLDAAGTFGTQTISGWGPFGKMLFDAG